MSNLSKKEAIEQLWHKGILWWKLDECQKDLYNSFQDSDSKIIVWNSTRRLGKSTTLLIIALETCLKSKNIVVKYVAPEQKQVKTFTRQLIRKILSDCPVELKPKYMTQDVTWKFANGSELQLAGSDNGNAENLRGGEASLCVVDEAGFCSDLKYVVESVLLPTMTTTNGKAILASTPPPASDHEFASHFIKLAKLKGSYVEKTIDDIDEKRISKEQKERYIEELGGRDSITVRREYFCEIITDTQRAVIPEFIEAKEEIVKDWKKPPFYDAYTSMDVGGRDLTANLFGYYDFRNDKVVIEDEYTINGPDMTTNKIAAAIKEKEELHFVDSYGLPKKPYLRYSDNNNKILLNDLQLLHGLTFLPTPKDEMIAQHNRLRMMIEDGKIIIHPRCVHLINHLETATWDKRGKKYEHNVDKDGRLHHYDCLAALIYMIRNIVYTRNPYPKGYDLPNGSIFVNDNILNPLTALERSVKAIFTPRTSIYRNKR